MNRTHETVALPLPILGVIQLANNDVGDTLVGLIVTGGSTRIQHSVELLPLLRSEATQVHTATVQKGARLLRLPRTNLGQHLLIVPATACGGGLLEQILGGRTAAHTADGLVDGGEIAAHAP